MTTAVLDFRKPRRLLQSIAQRAPNSPLGRQRAHDVRNLLRIQPAQIEKLERAIDRLNADLPALRSFVIPGGPPAAAWA